MSSSESEESDDIGRDGGGDGDVGGEDAFWWGSGQLFLGQALSVKPSRMGNC